MEFITLRDPKQHFITSKISSSDMVMFCSLLLVRFTYAVLTTQQIRCVPVKAATQCPINWIPATQEIRQFQPCPLQKTVG